MRAGGTGVARYGGHSGHIGALLVNFARRARKNMRSRSRGTDARPSYAVIARSEATKQSRGGAEPLAELGNRTTGLDCFAVARNDGIRRGGETPESAVHQPPHLAMRRGLKRSPLAFRRSTAALTQGSRRPKGSVPGHVSWDVGHTGVTRRALSQSREAPPTPVVMPGD